jgi:chitodextrinase
MRWFPSLLLLMGVVSTGCDTTAPTVPNPLADSVVSCSQIDLAWGASVDSGGSGLAGYRIYRNGGFVKQVAASNRTASDTGLVQSTAYTYQVTAVDTAGNQSSGSMLATGITPICSTTTTIATATTTSTTSPTLEKIAPSVPTGLMATAASCSQVNLAWNASTDSGGSGLAGYRVYRNNTFLKQVATTSTSDTGLAGSTIYSYQVSAIDNAGNESSRSATVSTNTPVCTASTGAYLWAKRMGGTVLADSVVPYGVAVDSSGNSYVTGVLYGTVNFGTGGLASAGRGDMFIAKYSAAGVPQWVRRFGDAADQFGTAIAVDTSGNVYVTGYFYGTVDFGGGPLTSNGYEIVLAKYTTNGVHVWSRALGGSSSDMGQAIAVDASGNVLVAGQFASTVDFGGGPLTSAGGYDGFLAKYTTNGAFAWARRVGGASLDTVTGLGIDSSGNPTIVGYFQGTSNFGGANLTSAGASDIFVARYTAAGAHQWSARYGDADDQRAYGAGVDGAGNVAITGYFAGSISFGGPTFTNVGGADIFVAKLSATGAHIWSRAVGATGTYGAIGESVAIDASGNVVLTGEVSEPTDFGGGGVVPSVVTYDAFVAKYSPTGAYLWAHRYVSDWDDHGDGIAVDGNGNVITVGDFYQSEDFGGGLMSSPGGTDGFILKLTP